MAASVDLTRGAIAAIKEGGWEGMKPVLQVHDIRLMNTAQAQSTSERYRMVLADGIHIQQAMLATRMNGIVKAGALQKGSIVQLNEFVCNRIRDHRIIIVMSLEVLAENCDQIGDPKNYDGGSAAPQNRAPAPILSSSVLHLSNKGKEKIEELESKIRVLREQQMVSLVDEIAAEYQEQILSLRRDAEAKEQKLAEQWAAKNTMLSKFLEQMGCHQWPSS